MIVDTEVEMTWSPSNKKHFESFGYKWSKQGDKFKVKVSELSSGSQVKVEVLCDYCLERGKRTSYSRIYAKYVRTMNTSNHKKDCCKDCIGVRFIEVSQSLYGTNSPMQVDKIKDKSHANGILKKKYDIEFAKHEFEKCGYDLISDTYTGAHSKLDYTCSKHIDYGVQSISLHSMMRSNGCMVCGVEKRSGSNNVNWKGTKNLNQYLRNQIKHWKKSSMEKHEYKCVISGVKSNKLVIHHLRSFSRIVDECLSELCLDAREEVNMYTDDELKMIVELLREKHSKLLGVPIMPEYHDKFHMIYGKGKNDEIQFEKYKDSMRGEVLI